MNKIKNIHKQNFKQFLKFTFFSLGAGIIQLGSFTIFNEIFLWNYWLGYLIALALSVLFNFIVNRKFTFKSAKNVPIAMSLAFLFYVFFTPASTLWGSALEKVGWNEYLILALTMIINFILEFLWNRFVIYRKSINTDIKKKEEN